MNSKVVRLTELDFPSLSEDRYNERLPILQQQLQAFQQMVYLRKEKVVIAVEGTDASGKGGMIKTLIHSMDPRGYRVHCIGAPYGQELHEHYLQRFWRRIPRQGNIAIFDRTWYGRVLIEKIELDLPETRWLAAYQEIEAFERQLVNEGFLLVKIFLHISKDEQKRRFLKRLNNPEKCWKLTEADLHTRRYWDRYQQEYQLMLDNSLQVRFPWQVVAADNKYYTHVRCLEILIEACEARYGPPRLPDPDPAVKKLAADLK